ncbi:MAG: hypothetical protein COA62_10525 [Rhodobiaceae bacterium]|nr:MAG: hypothetical protein COA62_10525 [Rhodobiaceae bacterium]
MTEKTPPSKSERRRRAILDAAQEQVLSEGMIDFGLRRVAARADLGLSSLQHHFPTLKKLLSAVTADTLQQEETYLRACIESLPSDPSIAFEKAVLRLCDHAQEETRLAFLTHIWAEGERDPDVMTGMQELYATWRRELVKLLRPLYPSLTFVQLDQIAHLLVAGIEGHRITGGTNASAEHNSTLAARHLLDAIRAFADTLAPPPASPRFV